MEWRGQRKQSTTRGWPQWPMGSWHRFSFGSLVSTEQACRRTSRVARHHGTGKEQSGRGKAAAALCPPHRALVTVIEAVKWRPARRCCREICVVRWERSVGVLARQLGRALGHGRRCDGEDAGVGEMAPPGLGPSAAVERLEAASRMMHDGDSILLALPNNGMKRGEDGDQDGVGSRTQGVRA